MQGNKGLLDNGNGQIYNEFDKNLTNRLIKKWRRKIWIKPQ